MKTLIRWGPFRTLSVFPEQVNRLFEDAFFRGRTGELALTGWSPAVDTYETPEELVVKADLPELQEKELDIRVENNTLTIRGERKFEQTVSEDNYVRVERTYGSFHRNFSLPSTVNADAVTAEYRNGVLTVHLPKREESKPKQIKVSASHNGK